MSETITHDRTSPLDAFASMPPRDNLPVPQVLPPSTPARAFGAQAVAVKRDTNHVLQKLRALAAAAGTDWYYRFPVQNRREGRTDWIEGPSIRLANDLAREYGNCEIETRVLDMGNEWLIYARFTDYETGFAMERPFQQRKSQRSVGGKAGDEGRALDIALQIGVSKAIRNVVCNALQTFADFAFEEARNALVGRIGQDLPGWRGRVADRLAENNVDVKRVEAVIGRALGEWLAPDIARVIAMVKAVLDGMASMDETFPPLKAEQPAPPAPDAGLQKVAETPAKDHGREGPQGGAGQAQAQAGGEDAGQEGDGADAGLTAARKAGMNAAAKGVARKAVPGDYRDDPELAAAWQAGWDELKGGGK